MMIKEHPNVRININDLQWDPENPNEMSQDEEAGLRKSFTKFGITDPILIDQHNFIVHGNHRAAVLKELGATEIAAIQRHFKDDNERRLCSQTMNKLHGEYEKLKDSNQLLLLFQNKQLDELSELIARPREELQRIIQKGHPEMSFLQEETFDVDAALQDQQGEPITKTGDIWKLGSQRVMCGDCTKPEDVNKLMNGVTADMVFTDPPYGVDYASKNRFLNSVTLGERIEEPILGDNIEDYYKFYSDFLKQLPLNDTNSVYITIAGTQLLSLLSALKDTDYYFSQLLVWVKNNHVLGRTDYANKFELIIYCWKGKHEFYGDFQTTVWEIDKPQSSKLHPTMKPIELIAKAINNSSKPDALIFDPFLGSGSTLIACEQTQRYCYGLEIDAHYCDVIVKRWEALTGKKGELVKSRKEEEVTKI